MYLDKFGFQADPFQSTNAADEPEISNYFVPPPYFKAVVGDPSQPKSQVILAPRGGRKDRTKGHDRATEPRLKRFSLHRLRRVLDS